MGNDRTKLYSLLSIACLVGYAWLFYNLIEFPSENRKTIEVCLIKHVTNIPCPSCGSTRSVLSLLRGDLVESVYQNPFGLIIATIIFITPFWIAFDLFTKSGSLFNFYVWTEDILKQPKIAVPLILIVFMNWIWNIIKGL